MGRRARPDLGLKKLDLLELTLSEAEGTRKNDAGQGLGEAVTAAQAGLVTDLPGETLPVLTLLIHVAAATYVPLLCISSRLKQSESARTARVGLGTPLHYEANQILGGMESEM